jgi:hypothetical protein
VKAAVSTAMVLAAAVLAILATPARAENSIEWRLENPFRLFKKPEHTALHRDIFEKLKRTERKAPILSAERKLEERYGGQGWADEVFNETCYDQDGDRYTACRDYVLPKSHRVVVTLKEKPGFLDFFTTSATDGVCVWRATGKGGKPADERKAPCKSPAVLEIPYPEGARVTVTSGGSEVAQPIDIKVKDVLIVGLGDSFAAGEGNPVDYGFVDIAATGKREALDGYPARSGAWRKLNDKAFKQARARWWDRECHRSLYSHQLRAALQLAVENPKRAITFISFACSGAEIPEGLLLRKAVRECTPGESFQTPAQVSALSEELCRSVVRRSPMPQAVINRMPELRQFAEDDMRITRCLTPGGQPAMKRPIDLVLLSIGGNDVGFTPIVSDSLLSEGSIYRRLGSRMHSVYGTEEARKRLDLIRQRFDGLRFALEVLFGVHSEAGGGTTKVILTGYPNMGYAADGVSACGGTRGLEVFPPFQLDSAKVGKAEAFTRELNAQLAAVAGRRWTYVDAFRDAFRRHGLCASNGAGPQETHGRPSSRRNTAPTCRASAGSARRTTHSSRPTCMPRRWRISAPTALACIPLPCASSHGATGRRSRCSSPRPMAAPSTRPPRARRRLPTRWPRRHAIFLTTGIRRPLQRPIRLVSDSRLPRSAARPYGLRASASSVCMPFTPTLARNPRS